VDRPLRLYSQAIADLNTSLVNGDKNVIPELIERSIADLMRDSDVQDIAKTSGLTERQVAQIKLHIFFMLHFVDIKNAVNGKMVTTGQGWRYFAPDMDIIEAWKRLSEGRGLPEDLDVLLPHELGESILVNKGMKYHDAHLIMNEMSNGIFNWGKIIPEHDVRRPDGTVLAHENYDSWVRPLEDAGEQDDGSVRPLP